MVACALWVEVDGEVIGAAASLALVAVEFFALFGEASPVLGVSAVCALFGVSSCLVLCVVAWAVAVAGGQWHRSLGSGRAWQPRAQSATKFGVLMRVRLGWLWPLVPRRVAPVGRRLGLRWAGWRWCCRLRCSARAMASCSGWVPGLTPLTPLPMAGMPRSLRVSPAALAFERIGSSPASSMTSLRISACRRSRRAVSRRRTSARVMVTIRRGGLSSRGIWAARGCFWATQRWCARADCEASSPIITVGIGQSRVALCDGCVELPPSSC